MKIVPFDSNQPQSIVRLKMEPLEKNQGVRIIACDERGVGIIAGYLLEINPNGIFLEPSVNSSLGFPLDSRGRLRISE